MLQILIDAAVLVFVLRMVSNDELELTTAAIVALVTSLATTGIVIGLAVALGPLPGLVLGVILSAVGLAVAISALFGVEIKRAALAAVVFFAVHVGTSFLFSAMLG